VPPRAERTAVFQAQATQAGGDRQSQAPASKIPAPPKSRGPSVERIVVREQDFRRCGGDLEELRRCQVARWVEEEERPEDLPYAVRFERSCRSRVEVRDPWLGLANPDQMRQVSEADRIVNQVWVTSPEKTGSGRSNSEDAAVRGREAFTSARRKLALLSSMQTAIAGSAVAGMRQPAADVAEGRCRGSRASSACQPMSSDPRCHETRQSETSEGSRLLQLRRARRRPESRESRSGSGNSLLRCRGRDGSRHGCDGKASRDTSTTRAESSCGGGLSDGACDNGRSSSEDVPVETDEAKQGLLPRGASEPPVIIPTAGLIASAAPPARDSHERLHAPPVQTTGWEAAKWRTQVAAAMESASVPVLEISPVLASVRSQEDSDSEVLPPRLSARLARAGLLLPPAPMPPSRSRPCSPHPPIPANDAAEAAGSERAAVGGRPPSPIGAGREAVEELREQRASQRRTRQRPPASLQLVPGPARRQQRSWH